MGLQTNISWTDATWNIARGCHKVYDVHPGTKQKVSECEFCYMYRESLGGTRHKPKEVVQTSTKSGGAFTLPLRLKTGLKVFASSLTDFWHKDCAPSRLDALRIIMRRPDLIFQIPTKRPELILEALRTAFLQAVALGDTVMENWLGDWMDKKPPANVWLGVSVGQQHTALKRIFRLLEVPAALHWVSMEPLLEAVDLTRLRPDPANTTTFNALTGRWSTGMPAFVGKINWVVVGGESGNETGLYRYRPCELPWLKSVVDQCAAHGTACWVKQTGTYLAKQLGIYDKDNRHGTLPDRWPPSLQVQSFPN